MDEGPDRRVSAFDLARVIERVSRRFLDYLRLELGKLGIDDISPAQVMILLTIGQGEIAVRDLLDRGHYGGSNASYNLKQLVESGYLERGASPRDRRLARISLSLKGQMLCERLRQIDEASACGARSGNALDADFLTTHETLRRLEQWWNDSLRYSGILLASCISYSFIVRDLVNSLL
ncbi:MarR family transcriptional regulator [Bosea sp. (in: a-proteobacteria)]|uniref:MarR family transcriptional regulator n=1 Tax=Bosea sp. (in: a-proteobacteria) TaxID=1871050 RepID=UPI002632F5ED|nr:MarR family transcriptional regulator [Bosea sp. (in: a-proteobacteria)]MCO5091274.1 MarR family transcriptional regulator [Bosea sp. (in: a-proteobacteria)]